MEPISTALAAFAAVQKAVSLIKAAHAAGKDLASLGGLIGNYFDAKHQAVKAVKSAKRSGGSNLGKAVEIELALKSQRDFEEQLKGLFFPNNMDIWQSIQLRVAQMNKEDEEDELRARVQARKLKKQREEFIELVTIVIALIILFILLGGGFYILYDHCQAVNCRR